MNGAKSHPFVNVRKLRESCFSFKLLVKLINRHSSQLYAHLWGSHHLHTPTYIYTQTQRVSKSQTKKRPLIFSFHHSGNICCAVLNEEKRCYLFRQLQLILYLFNTYYVMHVC